jgi:metallophosphoesterase (TIGR00282 family)
VRTLTVLFVGDVMGSPGRRIARRVLPDLVEERGVDLLIVNCENLAGGRGVTRSTIEEIFALGAHVLTGGNHSWDKRDSLPLFDNEKRLLRPANYPDVNPGSGSVVVECKGVPIQVLSLQGRVFMPPADCPFQVADRLLMEGRAQGAQLALVDFHAEATSEKRALGWHLDGRVAAVVGTHTHVQTADEEVLPGGTAYLSDLGMTGPHRSVIGMRTEGVLARFLTGRPQRFEVASEDLRLHGALVQIGVGDRKAVSIERVSVRSEA